MVILNRVYGLLNSTKNQSKTPHFSKNEWILHYRCAKQSCAPIANELKHAEWMVSRMELDDGTYKAKKTIDFQDAIKYYEKFKNKPEILTASLYPNIIS